MVEGPEQMTADSEAGLHEAVHRRDALQMGRRLEAAPLAFPWPGRLMRDCVGYSSSHIM